jgi:general secretion pathway protein D
VPDARANTLLIRAERGDFELIQTLVGQIDVRPLQVLIEVLIAEVRHDRAIGVSTDGVLGTTSVPGTQLNVSGALGPEGLGDFALRVMGIGGTDASATLSLAARRGNVRILSRPVILAANNEQASILVGSQRPFVQVQRALPTDGATRDQIVQYKEVGTRLTVTPAISVDGSVHLEVSQEISSATAETAFDAPVISSRSVQTQLIVRDGQTVVLGGLADRQLESTSQGIPFLSAIPIIGGLFGSRQRRTTETELFIFIKPQVIRTDDDAMRLSTPLSNRLAPVPP